MRRTYPELRDTHEPAVAVLPERFGRYVASDRTFEFANRSLLQLAYCDAEADLQRFQSKEFQLLLLDEASHLPWRWIVYLSSRVRTATAGVPLGVVLATNPGGIAHADLKRRFVDAAPAEQPFELDLEGARFPAVYIPARVTDNLRLMQSDPSYLDRLNALPEAERRALRDGDWDVYVGQVFGEWSRERHVCEPFTVPPAWPRWVGLDYGYHAPAAVYWLARGPEGVVVYRELYGTGLRDIDLAAQVRTLSEGERIVACYADPACQNASPSGDSIAGVFGRAGVPLVPANNDRLAGKQRVHEALGSGLRVFATCVNLIRTLPALPYDRHRVEDVDTDAEDHAYDALRYALMGAPPAQVPAAKISYGLRGQIAAQRQRADDGWWRGKGVDPFVGTYPRNPGRHTVKT